MYVTTFYSFKGGVGRTMALVNAGIDLAQRGLKVLLIDFDLAAPGLDTFELLKESDSAEGLVEFVNEYLTINRSPCAANYLQPCPSAGSAGGELWVMPAAVRNSGYANKFLEIDWNRLYLRRDGYLLFEDLKAQWRKHIEPDHVLIDSPTGFTDVGAIATRQLPDSVVVFFQPNEQHLLGLTEIVADVKAESEPPRSKRIQLSYVLSNVPDLDDENETIGRELRKFQQSLDWLEPPMTVHRYDNLSLLNQVVFTKDRPTSRLSGEYRQLVDEVILKNARDQTIAEF